MSHSVLGGALGWLRRPSLVRAGLAIVLLLGAVLVPDEAETLLVVGVVSAFVLALVEVAAAFRLERPGRPAAVVRGLGPAVGGTFALLGTDDPRTVVLTAVGAMLAVRSVADLTAALTVGRRAGLVHWLVGLSAAEGVAALAAFALSDLFGPAVVVATGFIWILGGVLAPIVPRERDALALTTAPIPRRDPLSEAERARIVDEFAFEGEERRERLLRFVVLLTIAAVIATYGVLSNSAAAVIGGMIVAPLMMPIQGLSVGLLSGVTRRAVGSGLALLGGVVLVLVLSMLIASTFRDLPVQLMNDQVVIRTSPSLPDLAIALAAGAAGGFALVHRGVAASLPGVAIAVSLVPPLCVSGAMIAGGESDLAIGAFTLFLVNFVAIVIASGAMLVAGGFGAVDARRGRRLLTLSAALVAALVSLAVPLAVSGLDTLRSENTESALRTAVTEWLEPVQPAELIDLTLEDGRASLLVASSVPPPSTEVLERHLGEALDEPPTVTVHWVRVETLPGPGA